MPVVIRDFEVLPGPEDRPGVTAAPPEPLPLTPEELEGMLRRLQARERRLRAD